MSITFTSIPVGIRTPGAYVEFANGAAGQGLAQWQRRILILGQALPAGSAAPLTPVRIFGAMAGQALFGRGSMLDRMIQALCAQNDSTETWAMSVADPGGGVAATYTLTVTGAPTASGTLALYIGGQSVQVAITANMTTAQVATAIAAQIAAQLDLPVAASAAASVVTLAVNWKGSSGAALDIRTNYYSTDVMPAGLALTIAAGTAGSGAVNMAGLVAAFGDKQWHTIVCPWTDGAVLAALTAELATRRGGMVMMDGIAFTAAKESQGALATLGEGQNSPDLSIAEAIGPVTVWERCAREAGAVDLSVGIDPALPLQTVVLSGDIAPNSSERLTQPERNALLYDGISTHTVDPGGVVQLERPITTYQLNGQGQPDPSYLDVTTMTTLSYLRFTLVQRWETKFPRMKVGKNGIAIAPGEAIVTPNTLQAELIALAREWEAAGLVQDVDSWKSGLVVQINASDATRVDAVIPPQIVTGLRVFAAQIAFSF